MSSPILKHTVPGEPPDPSFSPDTVCICFRSFSSSRCLGFAQCLGAGGAAWLLPLGVLWLFDSRHAARVDASRVNCPVFVLAGAQDRITPVSVVRRVAKKYRAPATYKEFGNHPHWVVGEPGWEEVAEYALNWLRAQ